CAACVWLIERAMMRTAGVQTANVNLAGKRLHLRWLDSQVQLSSLIASLAKIGYAAVPYDPEVAEGAVKRINRAMLFRLFFAGFAMMNLTLISIALYSGADQGQFRSFFHWMGFALATPTLLYSAFPFYKGAWSGLRNARLTMDLPIAIGLSVTYFYSVYVTLTGIGEVYFDTVTNLTFVILIGRYLEGMFRHQAVAATSRLMDLQPRVATLIKDGIEVITPIRAIKIGDHILIKPGYKVPVDGVVIEGVSRVDEAMLSGESLPVKKSLGMNVATGTLNVDGALLVEVQATLQHTLLAKIIRLVEQAQSSKAPVQRIADGIVPWFVLATLMAASFTFFVIHHGNFELSLMAAPSVLIITCPCALGMATPMSIAVASGLGAAHGILVKNGLVLETLSKVNHFVFDKTGTLTFGKMSVAHQQFAGGVDGLAVLRTAAAVEKYSEHSIARAIVQAAEAQHLGFRELSATGFLATAGLGVQAQVAGEWVCLGNLAWLNQQGVAGDTALQNA
ncbi:MAG: cation-translocating P-type ATPase, partial [Gallionella sp.]